MKKIGAGLAVLGVFLLIAVGCNSSDDDARSTIGADYNTQVTDDLVRQVQIGMTEKQVRDLLGEPKVFIPMTNANDAGWLYVYDGGKETAVGFTDGKVVFLPWIDGKPQ